MSIGLPIVAAVAIMCLVFLIRHGEAARRATFLTRAGFLLMAVFSVFVGLFVAGDAFTDPGGWAGVGLVASWTVPIFALAATAWYRPRVAIRLFSVLVVAAVGMSMWFAANPGWWRSFENRNGPVRDIIVFALSAPIGLLGLKRTTEAGAMLLVLAIVPVTVSSLGSDLGLSSLFLVSSPPAVTGVLYLLSGAMTPRSVPPRAGEAGPREMPRAA